jgi:long-subunit acyl-CoA synthetase (AMP-forming)
VSRSASHDHEIFCAWGTSVWSGESHLGPCTTPQAAPLFDKLVFSKVKTRLGGRVKLILTGGAPLARHVEDFLKVTMCCPVVQVSWHPRVITDVSF